MLKTLTSTIRCQVQQLQEQITDQLLHSIVIPAGQNSVEVPLIIIDDKIIEGTESATLTLTGASSTNFSFIPAPLSTSATAQIADDDAAANTTVVLLTKVSDAIEGVPMDNTESHYLQG